MSFLTLDRLTKTYDQTTVVSALSLSVARGELIALLGPSGCGKTTTLQMIAGFVEPSAGEIRLDGQNLTSMKPSQRGLGIVFQSYALFPHMTVAENVGFGLEMRGVDREERAMRVAQALGLVGLAPFAERYPRRLSGGQQQRVALARALVIKPHVLLLDEPLSNLDAKLREEMQLELRAIQRSLGTTTVLVTHDQNEAMALADRIVVMNKGAIEQIGAPYDVYEFPATPFVASFLGRTNVLDAEYDAARHELVIGDARWKVAPMPSKMAEISVRPEKIHFVGAEGAGIAARIKTRIFQGNHWLYQAEVGDRTLSIIQQNGAGIHPQEGDVVKIGWQAEDMRVRPKPEVSV